MPNDPDALTCGACGGSNLNTRGESRPRLAASDAPADLPWPWSILGRWPEGSSATIAGGPGSGKSSLAALLARHFPECEWITSEQHGRQAGAMLARIVGSDAMPLVTAVNGPDRLHERFKSRQGGLVVVDSITQTAGWEQQAAVAEAGVTWVRAEPGRRLLFIQQVNGRGDAAGQVAIPHLVDACLDVGADAGMRTLAAWKNRHGSIGSRYFRLGPSGPLAVDFPYAYSVEGEAGRYRLHPFPLSGAKWAGLFEKAAESGRAIRGGVACAAIPVNGYPDGYLQPADVDDRRAFAEAHGLRWTPTDDDPSDNGDTT